MCGIAGFNWNDENKIKKITELISHRGPDQAGFYFDENLSLGHRRLSILDLTENGKQPMTSSNGNFTIVFNGEIFNFKDIKEDLAAKGYKFNSKTDTEVLLYGYKEYGKKILDKINGQFAFAVYDKQKEEIFLARDRVGINPLYYYFKDDKFIFGSELKVIIGAGIEKKIDKFSLNYYFLYGYTPREKTILENCYKLKKAHYLVFDLKSKKIKEKNSYWSIKKEILIKDEEDAKKKILKELEKSIKMRMVADVPVGAFLSGGVDSSAVVALMSKYTKNLNTFSIKFDHNEFDESKYAKIISDKFKTNHHVIKFTAKDVRKLVPKLVEHYDEPFADSSMIATFLVSKVARKNVTVSLSGDGGDELFGGYPSYSIYRIIMRISNLLPRFLWKAGCFLLHKIKSDKLLKLSKLFEIGALPKELRFPKFRSFLYSNEFKELAGEKNAKKYFKKYRGDIKILKNSLIDGSNIDIDNYMVDDILTKVDRASLGNSLESRPPMLDHNFLELAFSIDPKLKIKNSEEKYILKKSLESILPKEILYRKKQGFGVPLKYYFRGELKDMVFKYVINYNKHNFYSKEITQEIKEIIKKKRWSKDYSRLIWAIMMFNMWYDKWILNNSINDE